MKGVAPATSHPPPRNPYLVTAGRGADFLDGATADPTALQKKRDALMILEGKRLYFL